MLIALNIFSFLLSFIRDTGVHITSDNNHKAVKFSFDCGTYFNSDSDENFFHCIIRVRESRVSAASNFRQCFAIHLSESNVVWFALYTLPSDNGRAQERMWRETSLTPWSCPGMRGMFRSFSTAEKKGLQPRTREAPLHDHIHSRTCSSSQTKMYRFRLFGFQCHLFHIKLVWCGHHKIFFYILEILLKWK